MSLLRMLWIKTDDNQILKLRDSYHPGFYILPRNDGLHLFQLLSREQVVVKNLRWEENKFTNLAIEKQHILMSLALQD
jgi:hypothetical protein